jgi:hypothetical protein
MALRRTPKRSAAEWAALFGRWEFAKGAATREGPTEAEATSSPPVGFGLAVSDLTFRNGSIGAMITLPTTGEQGRLVIGRDRANQQYYSAGGRTEIEHLPRVDHPKKVQLNDIFYA